MLLKNACIYDAIHELPFAGDILIKDGKIAAIGPELSAGEKDQILDLCGKRVYPGLVEAHSHLGTRTQGISGEIASDNNEHGDAAVPQLRALDCFYPQDMMVPEALAAGVTTVCTGPGSSNVVGGTFIAVKTVGNCVDDMLVKSPVAMKCALGENPKNRFQGKGAGTRMGIAAKLRETLFTARDYMIRKENAGDEYTKRPKYDMKCEAMIPVLKGEIPLKIHVHRADDICTAIRIAKEFGVKCTLEHVTEGHLVVDELVRAGFPVAIGPSFPTYGKYELRNKTASTAAVLANAGLCVSIITDSSVEPQCFLPLCAGIAVQEGMTPFQALQAVTINPARHIGIEDRVGSIEVGKDADLLIYEDDLLEMGTQVKTVIVDGKIVFQR